MLTLATSDSLAVVQMLLKAIEGMMNDLDQKCLLVVYCNHPMIVAGFSAPLDYAAEFFDLSLLNTTI